MKEQYSNIAIVIPAWNEEKVIRGVLEEVLKTFPYVICVDDGSSDRTKQEAEKTKAHVLSHLTNIGQGGALETGIKYALKNRAIDYFVTFDADGQHGLDDVEGMIEVIKKGNVDIVIGSRFLDKSKSTEVPLSKKILLYLARIFTNMTIGLNLTDTHNGLRVFNRKFAEKINLNHFGFSHASEFLEIIKKNDFQFVEMPVTINYTEYSKSKGQPIINAVNIIFDILFK
jgi:glycosyltransferase involved in cell wall biosynthesis